MWVWMQQCRSEPFSVWIARASSTLLLAVVLATFCSPARAVTCDPMLGTYFPPSGEGMADTENRLGVPPPMKMLSTARPVTRTLS